MRKPLELRPLASSSSATIKTQALALKVTPLTQIDSCQVEIRCYGSRVQVRLDDVCRCESGLPMRARVERPPQCGGRGAGVHPGADAYFGEVRQHERVRVNIPGVRVNETGCRVLRIIAERSGCEHGRRCAEVQLAHRDIAQAAAVSVPTVIRTLAALRDCELVIVRDNVQPNGARLPNGYELTALGLEVIRMAEELGTFAE